MTGCDLIVRRIAFSRDLSEHGDKSRSNRSRGSVRDRRRGWRWCCCLCAVAARCIKRQNAASPQKRPTHRIQVTVHGWNGISMTRIGRRESSTGALRATCSPQTCVSPTRTRPQITTSDIRSNWGPRFGGWPPSRLGTEIERGREGRRRRDRVSVLRNAARYLRCAGARRRPSGIGRVAAPPGRASGSIVVSPTHERAQHVRIGRNRVGAAFTSTNGRINLVCPGCVTIGNCRSPKDISDDVEESVLSHQDHWPDIARRRDSIIRLIPVPSVAKSR